MSVENESGESAVAATVAPLKRETILPNSDRGRVATLVAMCSLAGVAVGFGLSTAAMQAASDASRTIVITDVRSGYLDREVLPATDSVPWLGVGFHTAYDDGAMVGALIDRVFPATPAEVVGLIVGDVVVGYEHAPVHSSTELFRMVRASSVGAHPALAVIRHGHAIELRPTLSAIPVQLVRR